MLPCSIDAQQLRECLKRGGTWRVLHRRLQLAVENSRQKDFWLQRRGCCRGEVGVGMERLAATTRFRVKVVSSLKVPSGALVRGRDLNSSRNGND